jgi:hypothetical protein
MDTNRLSYKPRVRAPPSAPFPVLCQQDLRRPSHLCAGAVFFEVRMSVESEIIWMRVLVQFAREHLAILGTR